VHRTSSAADAAGGGRVSVVEDDRLIVINGNTSIRLHVFSAGRKTLVDALWSLTLFD
jgi:hypothetical protein